MFLHSREGSGYLQLDNYDSLSVCTLLCGMMKEEKGGEKERQGEKEEDMR